MISTGFIIIFTWFLRDLIADFYTDSMEIRALISDALKIMAFLQIFNQTQSVHEGIMRGLGKVGLTSLIVLISYYIFALPSGYLFAFHIGSHIDIDKQESIVGLGLNGLWFGLMVG